MAMKFQSAAPEPQKVPDVSPQISSSLPRIILKDPTGHPIDTDTSFQRSIYAAKARVQAAWRGEGTMENGDWRLAHFPPPARPDFSRPSMILSSRRPPHRLSKMEQPIQITESMPHLFEFLPDNYKPHYQEISWFVQRHDLYPWLLQQSISLDQAQGLPPLAAAALLRQTAEALPSRVYLPLVSGVPADDKYFSEVERRGEVLEYHGPCSGATRQGLCYGCEKNPGPHIHQDKPMRTGGGFTYYRRDRPHIERTKKNPVNWKVTIRGKPLKYAFEEGAEPLPNLDKYDVSVRMTAAGDKDGAHPVFILTEKLPTRPVSAGPSSGHSQQGADEELDAEAEGGGIEKVEIEFVPVEEDAVVETETGDEDEYIDEPTESGKKVDGQSNFLPGRQRGKLYKAGLVTSSSPHIDCSEPIEEPSQVSEHTSARLSSSLHSVDLKPHLPLLTRRRQAQDGSLDPETSSPLIHSPDYKLPPLVEAPKAFVVKRSDKRITEGADPFSDNREYDIPKGDGIDIRPSDRELTKFEDFIRPPDAPRETPSRTPSPVKSPDRPRPESTEAKMMLNSAVSPVSLQADQPVPPSTGKPVKHKNPVPPEPPKGGRRRSNATHTKVRVPKEIEHGSANSVDTLSLSDVTDVDMMSGSVSSDVSNGDTTPEPINGSVSSQSRAVAKYANIKGKNRLRAMIRFKKKDPKRVAPKRTLRMATIVNKDPSDGLRPGQHNSASSSSPVQEEVQEEEPLPPATPTERPKSLRFPQTFPAPGPAPNTPPTHPNTPKARARRPPRAARSAPRRVAGRPEAPDASETSEVTTEVTTATEPETEVDDTPLEPTQKVTKPPKKKVKKTVERKPAQVKPEITPDLDDSEDDDVFYIPEVEKVEIERQRTEVPPSPPSPPPAEGIEPPPLPTAAPPTPPVLPEYNIPQTTISRDLSETPLETPPPMPEPPPQRRPAPAAKTRSKRRERPRPQLVMTTVPKRDPKPMTDPLDYLAKYCIIHQDRLPHYERVFRKVTAEQQYRYADIPPADMPPATPQEGATKTHLTDHEKRMLKDITLISRTTKPNIAGQNAGDQMVAKVNFTLDHMMDKYEQLQAKLEQLKSEKVQVLAGLARKYFPQVASPNYNAGKRMKKGKKDKSPEGGSGKQVVFLDAQGSIVEERCPHSREGGPRRPTDTDIVNRLDQKMMARLKGEEGVSRLNMEIERMQQKLRTVDDRIEDLEDERRLLQLHARDTFIESQTEKAKSSAFLRKQSPLYRKLNPPQDVEMNLGEVEEALQQINSHLLTEKEMQYIYHILDLPGRQRVNLHTFSAIAALSEKVTQVEPFVKQLINKVDFEALSVKMHRCKELFYLLTEADPSVPEGTVPAEALSVDLAAGGLSHDNTSYVMSKFNREKSGLVDFLDFLTYIPLFIEIHERIVFDPLSKENIY